MFPLFVAGLSSSLRCSPSERRHTEPREGSHLVREISAEKGTPWVPVDKCNAKAVKLQSTPGPTTEPTTLR